MTLQQLERAATAVQQELAKVGMLHEKSRGIDVQVVWCRLPQIIVPDAVGFYLSESRGILPHLGWKQGQFHLAEWVLCRARRHPSFGG